MSAIHEALKKAQEERDGTNGPYLGVGQSGESRRKPPSLRGPVLAGVAALILLAAVGYLWFNMAGKKDILHDDASVGRGVPAPSPSANPVAKRAAPDPGKGSETTAAQGVVAPVAPPPSEKTSADVKGTGLPDKKNAELFFEQALKHHQNGRMGLSVELYQKSLQYDENFAPSLNNLAVIAMEEGRFGAAKEGFQKAIRSDPGYADPYYNLACVSAREGQPGKALQYLREAFAKSPETRASAQNDPDLAPVRALPAFAELVKQTAPAAAIPPK